MDPLEKLHKCIECNETHIGEQLLNDKDSGISVTKLNIKIRGQTALHLAAKYGNEKILQLLLGKSEVNVNVHDDYLKSTPLILACQKGHKQIVSALLQRPDCDVNLSDVRGSTPLHHACGSGSLEIVKILVEHGATIKKKNNFGNTAFHRAACFDCVSIIQYLVEYSSKNEDGILENIVEIYNDDMQRMIHCASLNGCYATVKYLVEECKADIEAKDKNERTPLHIAAENSHEDIVNLLIENRANVDCRDFSLETPIMKASYLGFLNIVRVLHKNNSDLNLKERSSGMTALMFAALHNQTEVIDFLSSNGANIHLENHERKTALHYVVSKKSYEGAAILISKDANPLHPDVNRMTPLSIAEKNELDLIIQLFQEAKKKFQPINENDKEGPRILIDNDSSTPAIGESPRSMQPKWKVRGLSPSYLRKKPKEFPQRPQSTSSLTKKQYTRKRSDSQSSREDSVIKSARGSSSLHIHTNIAIKNSKPVIDSPTSRKKKKSIKKKPKTPTSATKKKYKTKKDKSGSSAINEDSEQERIVSSLGNVNGESDSSYSPQESPHDFAQESNETKYNNGIQIETMNDVIDAVSALENNNLNATKQKTKSKVNHGPKHEMKLARLQSLAPATDSTITWSEAGHVLGRGAFGEVVLGICEDGTLIGVKRLSISDSNFKRVEKEVRLLQRLKHQHICRYLGCQISDDGHSSLDILLEYCSEGTLNTFMRKIKRTGVRIRTLQIYLKQILLGLKYIHDLGLLHRDLKPDNILIHSSGLIKIADFGCSKVLEESMSTISQQGTPEFLSAELIKDEIVKGYEKAIDIWALGILTYELACGRSIWKDMGFTATNRFALMFKVANLESDPNLPERLKLPSLRDFIESCLRIDPRKRLTTDELLKHPFLTDVTFHNMRDEDILEEIEENKPEAINLLEFDSAGNLKDNSCLGSIYDQTLCRLDSVSL